MLILCDEMSLLGVWTEELVHQLRAHLPDTRTTDHTLLKRSGIQLVECRAWKNERNKVPIHNCLIQDSTGRLPHQAQPTGKDLINDLQFIVGRERSR